MSQHYIHDSDTNKTRGVESPSFSEPMTLSSSAPISLPIMSHCDAMGDAMAMAEKVIAASKRRRVEGSTAAATIASISLIASAESGESESATASGRAARLPSCALDIGKDIKRECMPNLNLGGKSESTGLASASDLERSVVRLLDGSLVGSTTVSAAGSLSQSITGVTPDFPEQPEAKLPSHASSASESTTEESALRSLLSFNGGDTCRHYSDSLMLLRQHHRPNKLISLPHFLENEGEIQSRKLASGEVATWAVEEVKGDAGESSFYSDLDRKMPTAWRSSELVKLPSAEESTSPLNWEARASQDGWSSREIIADLAADILQTEGLQVSAQTGVEADAKVGGMTSREDAQFLPMLKCSKSSNCSNEDPNDHNRHEYFDDGDDDEGDVSGEDDFDDEDDGDEEKVKLSLMNALGTIPNFATSQWNGMAAAPTDMSAFESLAFPGVKAASSLSGRCRRERESSSRIFAAGIEADSLQGGQFRDAEDNSYATRDRSFMHLSGPLAMSSQGGRQRSLYGELKGDQSYLGPSTLNSAQYYQGVSSCDFFANMEPEFLQGEKVRNLVMEEHIVGGVDNWKRGPLEKNHSFKFNGMESTAINCNRVPAASFGAATAPAASCAREISTHEAMSRGKASTSSQQNEEKNSSKSKKSPSLVAKIALADHDEMALFESRPSFAPNPIGGSSQNALAQLEASSSLQDKTTRVHSDEKTFLSKPPSSGFTNAHEQLSWGIIANLEAEIRQQEEHERTHQDSSFAAWSKDTFANTVTSQSVHSKGLRRSLVASWRTDQVVMGGASPPQQTAIPEDSFTINEHMPRGMQDDTRMMPYGSSITWAETMRHERDTLAVTQPAPRPYQTRGELNTSAVRTRTLASGIDRQGSSLETIVNAEALIPQQQGGNGYDLGQAKFPDRPTPQSTSPNRSLGGLLGPSREVIASIEADISLQDMEEIRLEMGRRGVWSNQVVLGPYGSALRSSSLLGVHQHRMASRDNFNMGLNAMSLQQHRWHARPRINGSSYIPESARHTLADQISNMAIDTMQSNTGEGYDLNDDISVNSIDSCVSYDGKCTSIYALRTQTREQELACLALHDAICDLYGAPVRRILREFPMATRFVRADDETGNVQLHYGEFILPAFFQKNATSF